MLQKDPKFRYNSAAQTAEVLEAWLAKYKAQRVLQPTQAGDSGSSLNLGDESEAASGSKLGSAIDTVSNRAGDTVAGRSGDGLSLSPSDSGVLVRLEKKASASDSGSTINLEAEIGRRTPASRGGSSASSMTKGAAFPNASKSAVKNAGSSAIRPAAAPAKPAPSTPIPEKGASRFLLITGLVVMFFLAIALGAGIAVFVLSKPDTPVTNQNTAIPQTQTVVGAG